MLCSVKLKISRRIYRTAEEIEALVAQFRRLDVSARQFALEHKISPGSFRNWLHPRRRKPRAQPRWVEVVSPAAGTGAVVTVEVPNGLKIHLGAGFNVPAVAQFVRLLRQP